MKKIHTLLFVMMIGFTSGYSQTWEKIYTGYNYIFKGIDFPGGQSNIAYAGGQHLTYMGNGIVIKTTNGGTTWSQLWFGTQQGIEGLSFPDLNTGYVCGWSHYFAKTTDGGVTWTVQNPGPASDIYFYTDVIFKDALHGVVTAQTNTSAAVYSTSNGGATWTAGTGLASIPYKVTYVTANTYFLVGNGGEIQKSTDGGLTWITVKSGLGLLTGINFYNPMIGIATAADYSWIHKTFDGGVTWQAQQIQGTDPIWRGAAWKNQNEVAICGTPETIFRSTDGGSQWVNDYPTSAYNGALYEVLYTTDGGAYCIGSQGYFYRKLVPLVAAYTAANTTICNGTSVQFTDQTAGSPASWAWTFEGGTPATSTLQNPQVTYATPGVYDVSLTVTRGPATNTLTKPDYIHVDGNVTATPALPSGPASICAPQDFTYSIPAIPQATSYIWTATPASAGTFSGTGPSVTFSASGSWFGAFTIKVAGTSACGAGPVSPVLNVVSNQLPNIYSMLVGGDYCAGQAGIEVKLSDSDLGFNYQLFKDGVASGSPLAGTGNTLSFGVKPAGIYTASCTLGACVANMLGSTNIYMLDLPSAAAQPGGTSVMCNNIAGNYTASLPANSATLLWTLTPATAGTVAQPNTTTATVTWNPAFSGAVAITVQGQNSCGNGPVSPAFNVTVNAMPAPVVTGNASVCKNQSIQYSTPLNTGSTYVWTVTNGTISSGQGSNQVTVLWSTTGNGTVKVVETSAATCAGTSPVVSVVISPCTGTEEAKTEGLNIYPNPASDQLNVSFVDASNTALTVKIFNQLGKEVYKSVSTNSADHSQMQIDISHLNPGTYILQIISDNQVYSKHFVKK